MRQQPSFTVRELAERVQGRVEGDPDRRIRDVNVVEHAGPEDITFLTNRRYLSDALASKAGAIVCSPEEQVAGHTLIRHPHPYLAFSRLIDLFRPRPERRVTGIHPTAAIAADAAIGKDVNVGPFCVIEAGARVGDRVDIGAGSYVGEDVHVGDDTRLMPRVSLYAGVKVGKRCILDSGVVLGADGFGYTPGPEGLPVKVPQVGSVVLEDDVEMGANSCVDRALLGVTRIGRATKIDNNCVIAHNCEIGMGNIFVAQSGVSGSTKIGNGCTFAAQVGLVGHIELADGVMVGAQSGVTKDWPKGSVILGSPAAEIRFAKKRYAMIDKLPDLREEFLALKKRVAELEKKVAG